ncbi:MAG TPA: polyprenyl synthetase family protein, partial [Thermoplasmatales archaeon]|nr:polyprenyl synthetase family protein [Thermoplasmatales archaeon]
MGGQLTERKWRGNSAYRWMSGGRKMRAKEVEDFSTILRQRIELVNDEIERILLEENPFLLPRNVEYEDPVVHTLWSGGKRIRPILCLFACDAVGGEEIKALPTAAGVEFLHTFTLVHDDVMDRTTLRRGRPSLHHLWGEPIAITAGDTLYSLAFKSFSKNAEVEGVSDEQVRKVIEVATEKCIALAKGQTMDIVFEGRENVDLKEYFQMVKLKTSSLLELSLEAGGIIGGGSEREIDALEKFGTFSGIAFQIQDDILDIEGKDTGKPVGTDLRRGKKTVILIHALENADESERRR